MERDSGQISVDSTPFQQHQFFQGGGGTQLLHDRSLSNVRRGESPWLAGANWSSSGSNGECSCRRDEWRTQSWDWDSVAFTAQRANGATGGPGWDMPRVGVNGNYRKDSEVSVRGTGTPDTNHQVIQIDDDDDDETEMRGQTFFGREAPSSPLNEANPHNRGDTSPEDDGPLSLKLGGNVYEFLEENGVQNGKHGRSSSPQSQLPTCQVDGCMADLSKAKDYHRRHKVCEMHSKAGKALVGRVLQRFCQQCSRFHPLDQFDEGKRSCRRRLAGHNKRRRKAQPDPAVSQAFMMAEGQANGKSSDILTLLSVLAKIQGPLERTNNTASDHDMLLKCLRQAGCLPTNGLEDLNRVAPSWSQLLLNSDPVTSQVDPSFLSPQSSELNVLLSPTQQEAYSLMLQNNLKQVARAAEVNLMSRVGMNGMSGIMPYGLSVVEASISQAGFFQRPDEQASIARGMLHSSPIRLPGAMDPAQLLASVALTMQQNNQGAWQGSHYSANGHSMSAPSQNVTPPYSSVETRDFINDRLDNIQERDTNFGNQVDRQAPWLTNAALNSHQRPFSETQHALQRPSIDLQRPLSQQGSDSSQSGSPSGQQSPGTPEPIWENRNSRISIKLFDKHPGQFPEGLRSQINKWLSHRPSDMESYIRPGCIILTVFLSMPESAWVELVEDLSGSLKRLLISSSCDFWCTGRILVQVEQRSVLIIDGQIIGCSVSDPLNSPYIQSVRPLAIMSGQQTSLVVTGLNLIKTGTRLLCAFNGKYLSEEAFEHYETDDDEEVALGGVSDAEEDAVPSSIQQEETVVKIAVSGNSVPNAADDQTGVATHLPGEEPTIVDEAEVSGEVSRTTDGIYDEDVNPRFQPVVQVNGTFGISGMSSSSFGRCFIEVDQDTLEGNWKPIIVADGPICAEVRCLEHEIETAAHKAGKAAEEQGLQPSAVHCCMELARLVKEKEVACFLHELGWFFQRSHVEYCDGSFHASQVSSLRLKQLLVYSVERNWCAVVTKLLDIAFGTEDFDVAFREFSAALQEEVSLLHRAVRKKCRPMVELLLSYAPSFMLGLNDTNSSSFKQKLKFKVKWGSIFKPDMRGPAGLTPLHIAATIKDAEHIVDALTSDPGQVGLRAWLTVQDDSGETPLSCALVGGNWKAVQVVRAKLAHLENPDSPDAHWDQHLRGDSLVQLELPVWRTSAIIEAPKPPRHSQPVNCRDVDFLRLPPHVGGVKGDIYRPFLVSIMSIASICVCVCLLLKSPPHLENVESPFSWELLEQGFQ